MFALTRPSTGATVSVPNLQGMDEKTAQTEANQSGLLVSYSQRTADDPAGKIVSQSPKSGYFLGRGGTVKLVVSKGPPPVVVPNLIDMNRDKAIATLRGLGLKAKVVQGAVTPLNRVYSQDPPAGSKVPQGSTVTIRII